MTNENKIGVIILVIALSTMATYFFIDTSQTDRIIEKTKIEYPLIEAEDSLFSKVENIYSLDRSRFRNHPHQALLTLSTTGKKWLCVGYELKTEETLDNLLSVGDILQKDSQSGFINLLKIQKTDTLFYRFQLSDHSGYPIEQTQL